METAKRKRPRWQYKRMSLRFYLYEKQHGTCHYCWDKIPLELFSVDHKLPRSKGGTRTEKNVVGSCNNCNVAKGNMLYDEFVSSPYLSTRRSQNHGKKHYSFFWELGPML